MIEIVLLASADNDLQSAYNRYEARSDGLGDLFMRQTDIAISQIRRFPEIGKPITTRHRRVLLRRFPYGIFYTPYPTRIVITAILDLTQSPEDITKRLM